MSGARTPLGHYPSASFSYTEGRRPRSSVSGNYAAVHAVNGIEEDAAFTTPTARRTTFGKDAGGAGIQTPSGIPKRQSGAGLATGGLATGGKRQSTGLGVMAPPERRKKELGETF